MSKLYPDSYQYDLMKYNGSPTQTLITEAFKGNGTWVAQQKYDGALYMLEKIDNDTIYLFARTKSRKTGELVEKSANVPHIIAWAKNLPDDTILLGEIYVPGGKSNDVTKIMGCLPSRAVDRQFRSNGEFQPVHYYVFDCIRWAGLDFINTGFVARFKAFQDWFEDQPVNGYVEKSHVYTENFEEVLHNILASGGEGLVFKRFDAVYEPGKRPTKTYFKMKQHLDNIDLICIGLEDPVRKYTGKEIETWQYWIQRGEQNEYGAYQWYSDYGYHYKDYQQNPHIWEPITKPWFFGWKNAMTLGVYKNNELVEIGRVASGLTDNIREDMAIHPDNYINHVVEVEAMSTTKDGALRHPVFIRMRDDKNIEDCQWEEIFK